MRKINSLKKIRLFLEYLERNFHNPRKRTKEYLEKAFHPRIEFSDIYTYCINRHLIEYIKMDKTGNFILGVSLEGMEFLDRQELNDRNKQVFNATIINATATALNVFIILFSFILSLENRNWTSSLTLAVVGVFIVLLTGLLSKNIINFYLDR